MQTDIQTLIKKTEQAVPVGSTPGQERQMFDLPALITDFCTWYDQCLAGEKLQFTARVSPDIPRYIQGNQVLMKHLLFEPGRNSLLYAGPGEVSLEVDAEQHTSRRHSLSFTIRLADATIPLTREKDFFQSGATLSERDGFRFRLANLYYARMIAASLGGDIRIDKSAEFDLRYLVKISIFTTPP